MSTREGFRGGLKFRPGSWRREGGAEPGPDEGGKNAPARTVVRGRRGLSYCGLVYHLAELEDGQVHADNHGAEDAAEKNHQQGFDQ